MRKPYRKIPELSPQDIKRFWGRIHKAEPDECWEWLSYKNPNHYPRLRLPGGSRKSKHYLVHRIAYFIATGTDPSDLCVCHKCDNPRCCNPNHLFLGTPTDNMRDMSRKGRHTKKVPVTPRGEECHLSKYTSATVLRIRQMYNDNIGIRRIAEILSMPRRTVDDIAKRKRWQHIP